MPTAPRPPRRRQPGAPRRSHQTPHKAAGCRLHRHAAGLLLPQQDEDAQGWMPLWPLSLLPDSSGAPTLPSTRLPNPGWTPMLPTKAQRQCTSPHAHTWRPAADQTLMQLRVNATLELQAAATGLQQGHQTAALSTGHRRHHNCSQTPVNTAGQKRSCLDTSVVTSGVLCCRRHRDHAGTALQTASVRGHLHRRPEATLNC
ncbi:uncharacterized protein LOC124991517 [Sciurus carolinensis]|uniref:uncharacterized protein LOC124991517 n=1 Tax=Sciurus carolinensis TaxID=30640 RepID=UPI001FB539E8|nr:uncharacterized protein LOC124991517 [Sciurus carolinensis]